MKDYEIKSILMDELSLQEVHVSGDNRHFHIIAVGRVFEGMSRIQKQQYIYTPLMKYITDSCIHSLSIKAYSPKEWEQRPQTY